MNKLISVISVIMIASVLVTGCSDANENNPLLQEFTGVHATPPFSQIKNEHYMPAFKEAFAELRSDVDAIVNSSEEPTFANTIEALERSGSRLDVISRIFFNLNEAHTSDTMQSIALEVSPMLTELYNDVNLNPKLFDRVKYVYDMRETLALNVEQMRLLERSYKSFARGGAALSDGDKEKFRAITSELSELSLKFDKNSLDATNAFYIKVTDESQLAELPDFVRDGALQEAKAKGVDGWVFTLQAPSMIPFMTYSSNRMLKEQLWRAYNSRSYRSDFDNSDNVKRIAELRLNLAKLLGYPTYADFVLEERMAESRVNVTDFLAQLLGKGVDGAHSDVKQVSDYARSQGAEFEIMPWDFAYYAEKLKDNRYSISDEQTKPYFQLEKAQQGLFDLANRLYGITFTQNLDIDLYHEDVKAFDVTDKDGSFLAVLYMDYFPRQSKRAGAWMTGFRPQSVNNGVEVRPLVLVVCNFTKPTSTMPSLLTFDEVTTLLHEFGHALHGIFAKGEYASLSGTSVFRDFVELPSQIMENWATQSEYLDMWAMHYQTGVKIPADLVTKLIAARNYNAAYTHIRQVSFGLSDMAWHTITAPISGDVAAFEKEATKSTRVLPYVDGQCTATSFGHIFSGGYASGYYSYKWAEVLEADAFSLFEQKGVFNSDVADSFRDNVLSKGGSEHPMELYVRFRGHKPDVEALFKKMGL